MMIAYNEKELLSLVAEGDRLAFKKLYQEHLENIFNYIYLFTHCKYETEEIVQELFIKIWENRDRLKEVQSFKGYLFKAARNKVLDEVRKEQVRRRVMNDVKNGARLKEESTIDEVTYKDYCRVLQQAINQLPPKRRLIFRLNLENKVLAQSTRRYSSDLIR